MATTAQILTQLNKLLSVLMTSGLQNKDQPLFQVLVGLIKALIATNEGVITATTTANGGGPLSDQPFLTHQNVLAQLPQSRQLLAGDNINFDDSVFGERTVDVLLDQVILTGDDETATLPNSRELLAGTGVTFDDTVPNERTINVSAVDRTWSVLTNGDVDNPELIFAGGDVIMTHVP